MTKSDPSARAAFKAASITGTGLGIPTWSRPSKMRRSPFRQSLTSPTGLPTSVMAFCGQTMEQTPQPWQRSLGTGASPPNIRSAPKRQCRTHSPQRLQSLLSITGQGISTREELTASAPRSSARLGSSTSASTPRSPGTVTSSEAATQLFPVPPFPLAMATVSGFSGISDDGVPRGLHRSHGHRSYPRTGACRRGRPSPLRRRRPWPLSPA